tara:strand:+ start:314 stop:1429 length:1116 start_codon:yes stop_codon:yes gene_type:complete
MAEPSVSDVLMNIDYRDFPRLDNPPAIKSQEILGNYTLDNPRLGTIGPYKLSPLDKQREGIASMLMRLGEDDPYYANKFAKDLTLISEFIPGFGDVQGIREGQFMINEGNPLAGGIMMGASMIPLVPGSAVARQAMKLQQKIKKGKFDEQRELRNASSGGETTAAYNAAEKHRKSWQKDEKKLNNLIAKEYKKGNILFHGSQTKGIENLKLPEKGSTGGIYTLVNPTDPRFARYIEGLPSKGGPGSGYVLTPNFSKELDIDDMPEDILRKLTDLELYRGRPSRGGTGKLDLDINQILRGDKFLSSKTPMHIDKDLADIFTKEGYDALRFPRRDMRGEAETIVSLNPENLDIIDEIAYEDLDDFIRQLLSEQ